MLTNYIGNITYVEPGQIIVVVGKTTDAATRYPKFHAVCLIEYTTCQDQQIRSIHFYRLSFRTWNRLDLNFRTGKNSDDDIALNLSVDFRENVISRNTRINGLWGPKEYKEHLYEREDDSLNPIESGRNDKINMAIHKRLNRIL